MSTTCLDTQKYISNSDVCVCDLIASISAFPGEISDAICFPILGLLFVDRPQQLISANAQAKSTPALGLPDLTLAS